MNMNLIRRDRKNIINFRAGAVIEKIIEDTMDDFDMNRTEAIRHLISNGRLRVKNKSNLREMIG